MATPSSEEDFLQLYRDAFDRDKHVLEDFLVRKRVYEVLRTFRCLSEDEKQRIVEISGREERARETIELVRHQKNSLTSYIGFTRVFREYESSTCARVFPFLDHLRDAHLPLTRSNQARGAVGTIALSHENADVVVWLVASYEDEQAVCRVLEPYAREGSPTVPQKLKMFQLKEFSFHRMDDEPSILDPIIVCLVTPQPQARFPRAHTITSLLECITPRPKYAVLGGTCVANEGRADPGGVVVATKPELAADIAELQLMTELWDLKEDAWYDESNPRVKTSRSEQEMVLARLYAELKSPVRHQSKWFKGLGWDPAKVYSDNQPFHQLAPNANEIWRSGESWSPAPGDVLPYSPCPSLLCQARSSMLYAPSTFPLPPPTHTPEVVFGVVSNFTDKEGTVACSQDVYSFYLGAKKIQELNYWAAVGVRSVSGCNGDPEYREHSSELSARYLHSVLQHVRTKLQ